LKEALNKSIKKKPVKKAEDLSKVFGDTKFASVSKIIEQKAANIAQVSPPAPALEKNKIAEKIREA